jgi:hypothetical protein
VLVLFRLRLNLGSEKIKIWNREKQKRSLSAQTNIYMILRFLKCMERK